MTNTSRIALILLTLLLGRYGEPQTSASSRQEGYGTAIGVGFGINKINFDERSQSKGVTYFTGNFRFNFWDGDEPPRPGARSSRLKGFLEAEVGYWSDDDVSPFESDLLVGLNAIANVSAGSADVFFGAGFGYHFFGGRVSEELIDADDGAIGANLQFGVELNFSPSVAFFGVGRYDILTGDVYDFQTKILGGLRFKFH